LVFLTRNFHVPGLLPLLGMVRLDFTVDGGLVDLLAVLETLGLGLDYEVRAETLFILGGSTGFVEFWLSFDILLVPVVLLFEGHETQIILARDLEGDAPVERLLKRDPGHRLGEDTFLEGKVDLLLHLGGVFHLLLLLALVSREATSRAAGPCPVLLVFDPAIVVVIEALDVDPPLPINSLPMQLLLGLLQLPSLGAGAGVAPSGGLQTEKAPLLPAERPRAAGVLERAFSATTLFLHDGIIVGLDNLVLRENSHAGMLETNL